MVYAGTTGMLTGKKECKARPPAGKIRIVLYHLIVKHVKLHDMIVRDVRGKEGIFLRSCDNV